MLSFRARPLLVACLLLVAADPVGAQPPATKGKQVRLDRHGDPLPAGARARMGTTRFRTAGNADFALSPDGKMIALYAAKSIHLCALPGGKELLRFKADDEAGPPRVQFSPDGKTLVVSELWKLTFRRVDTGACLWSLQGEDGDQPEGVFAPDGKRFVSWGTDRLAYVWETATGRLLHKYPPLPDGQRYSFTASPDGKVLAAPIDAHRVRLWETSTARPLRTLPPQEKIWDSFILSPGGQTLVCPLGSGEKVHLWRTDRAGPVALALPASIWLESLQFTPDGKALAGLHFESAERSVLSFWDAATGKRVRAFESKEPLTAFAFSRDGRRLAVAGELSIRLFALATGKLLHTLRGGVDEKRRLAFSPDGKILLAQDGLAVRLWGAETAQELPVSQGHAYPVGTLAFTADGRTLVSGGQDGSVYLWEAATGRPLRELGRHPVGGVGSLALSGDGKVVASYGNREHRVRVWDSAGGRPLHNFEPIFWGGGMGMAGMIGMPGGSGGTWGGRWGAPLGFAQGGKPLVASGGPSSTVSLREVATGRQLLTLKAGGDVLDLTCSRDGRTLAVSVLAWQQAAGWEDQAPEPEKLIRVWELRGEEPGVRRTLKGAGELFFFPDGRILGALQAKGITTGGKAIRLWEVATGKEVLNVTLPRRCLFAQATPRGRLLAVEAAEQVTVWDVFTRKRVGRFQVPGKGVAAAALSPDGATLAVAPFDTTVLIWDLPGQAKAPPRELSPRELEQLWAELAGEAARAYRAVRTLSGSPRSAVPFLKGRLRPQAPRDHGPLIAQLGAARFAAREKAAKQLEREVYEAEPALRAALKKSPPLEVRRRINKILTALEQAPPAELLRGIRAVQALEYAGTPEALAVLRVLAGGAPEARLTREARRSLRRLVQRAVQR
jgi:WD40 repeat protein